MAQITRTITTHKYTFAKVSRIGGEIVTDNIFIVTTVNKIGERAASKIMKEHDCNAMVDHETVDEIRAMDLDFFVANSTVIEK